MWLRGGAPTAEVDSRVGGRDSAFSVFFNNFNFGKPKAESNVCFLYGEYTESRAESQGVIFTFAWVFERVVPSR
jgi:hypothetical protein